MAVLKNLARMTTNTTGTGAITLNSSVAGFLSFDAAGVEDQDVVTYAIQDGTSSEIGRGTYTASGTTLSRSVLKSTNSNNAISLSGQAEVFITPAAEDFDDLLREDDNLASIDDADEARANLYAAPMDAMSYLGMQVNGFHQVSQENGDTAVTASGGYPVDEWSIFFSGASISAERVAAPFTSRPDVPYGIEIEATTGASLSSGQYVMLSQRIEGQRLAKLALGTSGAMPFSIGFLVRANVSGRGHVALGNTSHNRSRVIAFDVTADTDTWVEIPAIPGDTTGTWVTDTSMGLRLSVCIGTGSTFQTTAGAWQSGDYLGAGDTTNFAATTGNKVWIGPLVLLPGVQLPSEEQFMALMRHADDDLRACHRYVWVWEASGVAEYFMLGRIVSATGGRFYREAPVPMRTTPTLVISSVGHFEVSSTANFAPSSVILGPSSPTMQVVEATIAGASVGPAILRSDASAGASARFVLNARM